MRVIEQAIGTLRKQITQRELVIKALESLDGFAQANGARVISQQARQRMALAQRQRWAKYRAEKAKHVKAGK